MSAWHTVTALDDRGDGIAELPGRTLRVPLAAPGDRVDRDGTIDPVSPCRATPPCALFGRCGGCSAQHLEPATYALWKTGRLTGALHRHGIDVPMAPLVTFPLATRRRITLTAADGRVGLRARASHDLVDVPHCPALAAPLAAALPALRELAAATAPARLTANLCDNGVDVAITVEAPPRKDRRRRGSKTAPRRAPPVVDDPAILRVTIDGETLFARETPVVQLGGADVALPPGAFLQASREGEKVLTDLVCEGVGDAGHIADLYCGLGTFALPLARKSAIHAVEEDGAALAALAAARAPGMKPITTLRRNLNQHPLSPAELAGFGAVVFDPPRSGAEPTARALAASAVPVVVAVSCEPATLARDLAVLQAGGYKITQVNPVDQFVASHHIEMVAWLRRDG